jgi:hypothetical protein
MKLHPRPFVLLVLLTASLLAHASSEHLLVTALQGEVAREGSQEPVQAFVKLKSGDRLQLKNGARVKLVFFESRRQEIWAGSGRLWLTASKGESDVLPEPQVKVLPEAMVKQIAKTPSLDSQGRAGVVRLRSISTPEALSKLDGDYKRMRMETVAADLNPEIFLLSGLLEMSQFERIEQVLNQMKASHPNNMEAQVLASLYKKTLKDKRDSGRAPL